MRKTGLFAGALIVIGSTCASAENWVSTPPSPNGLTAMYDTDSAYVEASTGLVYVMTCSDTVCRTGNPGQSALQYRINCPARTDSAFLGGTKWTPMAHQADNQYMAGDNEYLPGSSAALIIDSVCAKKASWPKRSK